jgi:predicted nucleic acid-binding protein
MTIYVESSALLAVLIKDGYSEQIANLIEQSAARVTSTLTILECRRAISRLASGNSISEATGREMLGELQQFEAASDVMEINLEVKKRAGEKFPIEPVRSLDAIHLATALEFLEIYPKLKILTLDKRIITNLEPLGLRSAELHL